MVKCDHMDENEGHELDETIWMNSDLVVMESL
jgi:hypothetical protein